MKDHHPEWEVVDGGKVVNVRLTTHWAGNTITRSDFELAEQMNNASEMAGRFKQYQRFFWEDTRQLASWQIGVACFILGSVAFRVATGPNYPKAETPYKRADMGINSSASRIVPKEVYNIHTEDKVDAFVAENLDAYSFAKMNGNERLDRPPLGI